MACYFRECSIQWYVIHNWLTTISEELNVCCLRLKWKLGPCSTQKYIFSCTSQLDRVCLFPTSMIHNGTHVWPYSDPYNLSIYNNHIKTVYGTQWNTCGISLTLCPFVNNHISMMNTRYIGFDGCVIPNAVLKYQKKVDGTHYTAEHMWDSPLTLCRCTCRSVWHLTYPD